MLVLLLLLLLLLLHLFPPSRSVSGFFFKEKQAAGEGVHGHVTGFWTSKMCHKKSIFNKGIDLWVQHFFQKHSKQERGDHTPTPPVPWGLRLGFWAFNILTGGSAPCRYVLIFWLTGIAAASTALLVGCIATNAEVAQQAAPAVTWRFKPWNGHENRADMILKLWTIASFDISGPTKIDSSLYWSEALQALYTFYICQNLGVFFLCQLLWNTCTEVFVPQLLFAGFFIQAEQIPVWLRWAQYTCALKYGIFGIKKMCIVTPCTSLVHYFFRPDI